MSRIFSYLNTYAKLWRILRCHDDTFMHRSGLSYLLAFRKAVNYMHTRCLEYDIISKMGISNGQGQTRILLLSQYLFPLPYVIDKMQIYTSLHKLFKFGTRYANYVSTCIIVFVYNTSTTSLIVIRRKY